MGGVGTGASFMANVRALDRIMLNLRTLHDKHSPNISLHLFGHELDIPILVAPMAGVGLNMNDAISEEVLAEALISGAASAGSLGMTGDGPNPLFTDVGFATLRKHGGRGFAIAKPRDTDAILRLAERAAEAGAWAFGVDVDAAGILGMVRAAIQPVWDGTAFQPRLIQPLSLSWDHRVVDGVAAAHFLRDLAAMLEDFRRISV